MRVFGAPADSATVTLVDQLRASGMAVRALYRAAPANGETAPDPSDADDLVTGQRAAPRREWREWREARDAHVLLAGSPVSGVDMARRAAMFRRSRTVHLWDARQRTDQLVVRALRRGYFGPWGLDGIFAVGTRAVDSFRGVTGRQVPIHVLPRVTDRGAGVEPAPALRPTIGYTGRLLPDRGVDLLLRSLARMPASARPRLQVAGSGPDDSSLRARSVRLGIDRWVDWLGDVDEATLDTARARWWGLIVPAQRADGWSLTIHAALNSGIPVIASHHIEAAHDRVRAGHNGTIVHDDDPDSWAAAIDEVTDPEVRRAYSAAARAVGRAFAPQHAAAWMLEVLADAERARRTDGRRLSGRSFVEEAWATLEPSELHPDAPA